MNTRRALLVLIPVVVVLSLALAVRVFAPRLVATRPAPDEQSVPAGSPLALTFSGSMRAESLTGLLSTDPPSKGPTTWVEDTLIYTPEQPWPAGITVTVQLAPGARSRLGLPMLEGQSWSFRVGRPLLTYLWPASGPADLYALEPVLGEIQRLTTTPHGLLDYSVHWAESAIYYAAVNASGGSDLFRLDRRDGETTLLLKCGAATCRSPQPSPLGDSLAYQRLVPSESGSGPITQVRLLQLDGAGSEMERAIRDLSQPSDILTWSSQGVLVFYEASQERLVFYDPQTGQERTHPNRGGQPGSWTPDGSAYVAPNILILPGLTASLGEPANPSHLMRYPPSGGQAEDLSRLLSLQDSSPAFSPDGNQLAFARKYLDQPRWSLGGQLWLMDPQGSQPRALTDDPVFNHTEFAWSPDGSQLAFMRFNQTTLTDPPEIWTVAADGSQPIRLVIGGYAPQWTP